MINQLKRLITYVKQIKGPAGPMGPPGPPGMLGKQGESAYEIYKRLNPESTLTEWEWLERISNPPRPTKPNFRFFAMWVKDTWDQLPEDQREHYINLYGFDDVEKQPLSIEGIINDVSEIPDHAEKGWCYFYSGDEGIYLKIGDQLKRIGDLTGSYGQTVGSAGIDLRAVTIENDVMSDHFSRSNTYVLNPGEVIKVHTGLSIWIDNPDFAGFILPRSGLGSNKGIVLGNLVGLIDSDYQGELIVSLWNRSNEPFTLNKGDRIAQYMVVPRQMFVLDFVDNYSQATQRGIDGFGSTGLR